MVYVCQGWNSNQLSDKALILRILNFDLRHSQAILYTPSKSSFEDGQSRSFLVAAICIENHWEQNYDD